MFFMALFSARAFAPGRWLLVGVILFALMYLAFLSRISIARIGHNFITSSMAWVGYISVGVVSILFCAAVIKVLFDTLGFAATKVTDSFSPSRRVFLSNTLGTALSMAVIPMSGYGVYRAVGRPKIKKVKIGKENMHSGLDGFRIVQISDIHAGLTIGMGTVERIVRMVNELKPDAVLITGDLVDGSADYIADYIKPLAGLKATYGSFFVTGNHEYYSGAASWINLVDALGIKVLNNSNHIIDHNGASLMIAGIPDTHASQFGFEAYDPAKAKQTDSHYDYSVIMSHRPEIAKEVAAQGYDLQLSGHTHGGQYFPWTVVIHLFHKYVRGLYKVDDMHLYVSQGTAYWGPPIRLGAESEITLITL